MPNGHKPVRTPADEDLPPWVPVSGRLTVVESSDIARNLGETPQPAETAPVPTAPPNERSQTSARGWTYIPGETFVSHL
jgi:hypothetical protein